MKILTTEKKRASNDKQNNSNDITKKGLHGVEV